MKQSPGQTHYEVLDISPKASDYEIGRARREARSLYEEDALASYSFFTPTERTELLDRIEEAYQVLSDSSRRGVYDRAIGIKPQADPSSGQVSMPGGDDDVVPPAESQLRQKVRRGVINGAAQRMLRRMEWAEVVTGHDLRQLRQAMGLGVEEIEAGSAVGPGLIPALEADCLEELPSWLTLRSSLMAYAEVLQTDPERIAAGYMKHLSSRE